MKQTRFLLLILMLVLVTGLAGQQGNVVLSTPNSIGRDQVTQGTIKHCLYRFELNEGNGGGTVTQISFTTNGRYNTSDITRFQLWGISSAEGSIGTATQMGSDITVIQGPGGTHSFTGLNFDVAKVTPNWSFWITMDLAIGAVTGNNIGINAMTANQIVLSNGNVSTSGTIDAGGEQEFIAFASLETDYFRTQTSGNWNAASTWESSHDGNNWATATISPNHLSEKIVIEHAVNVTADVTINNTTIETGASVTVNQGKILTLQYEAQRTELTIKGSLTVNGTFKRDRASIAISSGTLEIDNGGKYQHDVSESMVEIPTASWDRNSTCEITGYTSASGTQGGLNQNFGHFTWNCPNQTTDIDANGDLTGVYGNLTIASTGAGSFILGSGAGTTNVYANLTISGGTLDLNSGAEGERTLAVYGHLSLSNGTITETGGGYGTIALSKEGIQTLTTPNIYRITNDIRIVVNNGSTLEFAYPNTVLQIPEGRFTLQDGAGLIIKHAEGIASGIYGCIQASSATFSQLASYTYAGSALQMTGNDLPASVANLTVATADQRLSLSNNLTVTDKLIMTSGALNLNSNTLSYDLDATLVYNGTANQTTGDEWIHQMNNKIWIQNSGSAMLTLNADRIMESGGAVIVKEGARFALGSYVISNAYFFSALEGCTLTTAHPMGLRGNLSDFISISLNVTVTYIYNGTVPQVTGDLPDTSFAYLYINNPAGVTLSRSYPITGKAEVSSGSLFIMGSYELNGAGAFELKSNATLSTSHPSGINGNLQMTRTKTFAHSANYIYNGSVAQVTGNLLPTTCRSLTINNSHTNGVTLSRSLTINNTLTMTRGKLNLDNHTLSYGTSASLLYNGNLAQTSGGEWLATMSIPITISNTYGTGLVINANKTVTGSVTVSSGSVFNMANKAISGTGSFILQSSATLISSHLDGLNGNLQMTGIRNLSTDASYVFRIPESSFVPQYTGTIFPATVKNLTVESAYGLILNNNQPLTVTGQLSIAAGYFDLPSQYLKISGDGSNDPALQAFSISSTVSADNYPDKIKRQWSLNGRWNPRAIPIFDFYWDAADDNNYDWEGQHKIPSLYREGEEIVIQDGNYDVTSNPRWVKITNLTGDSSGRGVIYAGPSEGGTLPVTLSSFTAIINAFNQISLQWITQTETNVAGFRLYRNQEYDFSQAVMLNAFIPATNTSQTQMYVYADEEVYEDGLYYYWLENLDLDGSYQIHGPVSIQFMAHTIPTPELPVVQGIGKAYPNPFNPSLSLSFGMEKPGKVKIMVYNCKGQLVDTLFEGNKEKGNHTLSWNGRDQAGRELSSGVYLIYMQYEGGKSLRKVVLSK